MTSTIYLVLFVLSLTLSSCGGGEHTTADTGSAIFGLKFEEASAPAAMKLAPSMAPATDICSNYGIDTISGTVYNSSNAVIATGGPWACSAHQGTINNIPPGSNIRIAIKGTVSGSVVWQGETTGATIYAGQDTNVGSISMTYTGSDTTRPTVSAATPTGTTVPLTSPITVTFSEAMAASTIDTTTFTLKNGSVAVPGSVSYNATTKTATFTPTSSLSNSVIYTATVTADVTDMAANKMQSLYTWDFTTEAPPGSAPTTPTGVSATAADKQVTVSWTAVTGATSYNIYWSTTTGVTKTNGTQITGATSPYIHAALTNGTTYYYVVTAANSYGESAASSQVSAMPLPPITSAPTGVSAAAGNGQTTINWSTVTGATSYNLYWSTTTGVTTSNGTKITGATSPYIHTGRTNGTTYYYIVTAVNLGGESTASSQVSVMPVAPIPRKLPDTGQTGDYTTTFGEDSDYTINPPSYIDNGNGTVTDNVTGLMWQKESDHARRTWNDTVTYCDSLAQGGYDDWRLPSKKELISLVNYGAAVPAIYTTYFPNTDTYYKYYWTSTISANNSSGRWGVSFYWGDATNQGASANYYMRCVRGVPSQPSFYDNGTGTVTDNITSLMWQKQDDGATRNWEQAISYCEGLVLGGLSDWRLPNNKELESIVDDTRYSPAINTTYFINTKTAYYWSSSTFMNNSTYGWYLNFDDGIIRYVYSKYDLYYVRCVQGGQ